MRRIHIERIDLQHDKVIYHVKIGKITFFHTMLINTIRPNENAQKIEELYQQLKEVLQAQVEAELYAK